MLIHRKLDELRMAAVGSVVAEPFTIRFVPWRGQTAETIARYYANILLETFAFLSGPRFDLELPSPIPEIFIVPPDELVATSYYAPPARAILLPLRTNFATAPEEWEWMAAAARHELTHAMTHHCLYREGWHWLCEAFAVWVETQFTGSQHYLGYAQSWCDQPLRSLRTCSYDAFPFLTFLSNYLDKSALKGLWRKNNNCDSWQAVCDIVVSAGKDLKWFFADYCLHSYFPFGSSITQAIFERYGHRQAEEYQPVIESKVESLACRYYRVASQNSGGAIHVTAEGASWNHLRLSAALVLPGAVMGERIRGGCEERIDIAVRFGGADHAIIVVSNDTPQRRDFILRIEPGS